MSVIEPHDDDQPEPAHAPPSAIAVSPGDYLYIVANGESVI
jgi:hypothetical protein